MRATGIADLDRQDHRVDRAFDRRERADRGRDRLGNAVEPQRHLGNDAERAFRSDKQPGQVVAGGGFAGPPRCPNDAAVGEHDRQRQHVLPHRPVSHRVGARGARRRHAAERGVGAGIDREEQAGVAQVFVELLARDARLDGGVEVLGVDPQHAVHLRQVDADAAAPTPRRGPPARCRCRRRSPASCAAAQSLTIAATSSVLRAKATASGRMRGVVRFVLAVLRAHRCGGREPIAKELAQGGEQSRVERLADGEQAAACRAIKTATER